MIERESAQGASPTRRCRDAESAEVSDYTPIGDDPYGEIASEENSGREHGREENSGEEEVDQLGKLDILVNNAAFQRNQKSIEHVSEEQWDTPMGRPGQPEEIAPTYVFLASNPDSCFITGEIISLLGGDVTGG